MRDLFLLAFVGAFLAMGFKRPFFWVLTYIYIDLVTPQKIGWGPITALPLSLIAFVAAFVGWLLLDGKRGGHFGFRQTLILLLLAYCGLTTLGSPWPEAAWAKWDWVWKALVFAAFLPLTLRTRLRIEAAALVMVLSVATVVINGGIKTVLSGGGYGSLVTLVSDNSGIYEGSTLSTIAIATIPLIVWLARNGTIFPPSRPVYLFSAALVFASLLIPVGTQTRTGLLCIAALAGLTLRSVRYRSLYIAAGALVLLASVPFLPDSYTKRMETIGSHQADQSAGTRIAVWRWTIDFAKENPWGGGFDAYLGNSFTYETRKEVQVGSMVKVETGEVTDKQRAYHSAYFEMLGEQGWPGLATWLLLHVSGLWQMERIRRRLRSSTDPQERSWHGLATALQHGQMIYMVGAVFVGIAFQPFIFMLIALQIALAGKVLRRKPSGTRRRIPEPSPLSMGAARA